VNDGSTDSTEDFLSEFSRATPLNFRFVSHANQGVSASRNIGISLSKGDYIAFTDDDCILPTDWISRICGLWQSMSPTVAGFGGPLDTVIMTGSDTIAANFVRYLDEFNHIPVLKGKFVRPIHHSRLECGEMVPYLRTSNSSFRKRCLEEIGGFDVGFRRPGGEDPDLCYRLLASGFHLEFVPELIVQHCSRDSLVAYFKSLRNYVEGEMRKSRKTPQYPQEIRYSYRFIPLQKLVSSILSIISMPLLLFRLIKAKKYSMLQVFVFPLILSASKLFALFISIRVSLSEGRIH